MKGLDTGSSPTGILQKAGDVVVIKLGDAKSGAGGGTIFFYK